MLPVKGFLPVIALFTLAGCELIDRDPPPETALVGPTWQLRAFVSNGTVDADLGGRVYSIRFQSRGAMTFIRADCNHCGGGFASRPNQSLEIRPGPCTEAACPPGTRGEEFVEALGSVHSYRISGRELRLYYGNGNRSMRFFESDT